MAVKMVATLGGKRTRAASPEDSRVWRSKRPRRSHHPPRTFLLAKTAQQVKSRSLFQECLAFAMSVTSLLTWGALFLLLAG